MISLCRPAFSEEFEKAEEELEILYGQYLTYIRCLDALRDQVNVNSKSAQPFTDTGKTNGFNGNEAQNSLLMLPDGILDSSDEVSNEEDGLNEPESKNKKTAPPTKSSRSALNRNAKLRIKTGGLLNFLLLHTLWFIYHLL